MECVITNKSPKRYSCLFCDKLIHGGFEGCTCSAYRDEFERASVCTDCLKLYDELMQDKYRTILRVLFRREYFRGVGPVIDF